jgi:Spy/CpxP family protein refolding chaperone
MLGRRSTIALLTGALATVLAGCGATVDLPEAPPGATKGPVAMKATGWVAVVGEALGDVPLLPEQRKEIERLASEADARHATLAEVKQRAADALAAHVEAGKIDRAGLQPAVEAYADAWARTRIGDRTAVERLHALLEPGQRSALVDSLAERLEGRKKDKGSRMERLAALADELKLTSDQIERLREVMQRKRGERGDKGGHRKDWRRGKLDEMLEAFAGDELSLAGMPAYDDLRAKAGRKAERILGKVETAMPILTDEQRKLAAAKIRAHAADAP